MSAGAGCLLVVTRGDMHGRRRTAEPRTCCRSGRARPRDPRVRAPVVEVRRREGDRDPRVVRHVGDSVLPGAERSHRPAGGARRRPAPRTPSPPDARRAATGALGPPSRVRGVGVARVRARDPRGGVFPSPVMILSIVAVAMAGVAWVATRHHEPTERLVTPAAQQSPSATHTPYTQPKPRPHPPAKPDKPAFDRSQVVVEVFNNSSVPGLAGRVAGQAAHAGWQV